jgi:hypothetical protein
MLLALAALACFVPDADAAAQTCLGNPSYREHRVQAAGRAGVTGDDLTYGASLGGSFFRWDFQSIRFTSGTAANGFDVLTAGYGIEHGSARIAVCPLVEYARLFAGSSTVFSRRSASEEVGGFVGLVLNERAERRIVVSFGVSYHRQVTELTSLVPDLPDQRLESTLTRARIGAGVAIGRRMMLTPFFFLPLDGSDVRFVFVTAVTVGFGG